MKTVRDGAGRLLLPVLLLGLAADLLFRADGLGLNVTLWLTGAVWAWWHCRRRSEEPSSAAERALLCAVLAIGVAALWRENPMLRFLDAVALLVSFGLLTLVTAPPGTLDLWNLPLMRVCTAAVRLARRGVLGLVPIALDAGRPPRDGSGDPAPKYAAVLRGILLSVPALLIFGGLLGHADPAFGRFLERIVRFDVTALARHAVGIVAGSWVAATLLGGVLAEERNAASNLPAGFPVQLGAVESGIVLGLVNLLFAAFIAFQLPYLFGGAAWIERTSGVTLADYARQGFFELVAVSAMVLPLLLVLQPREGGEHRLYRSLAGCQVVLVLVIMASALERMGLYQQEFGLTGDRFFASAFMGGLAVTFCWFGATVLRGRPERFAGGALLAWAGWLLLLHGVNPERIIVEANLAHAERGGQLDAAFLARLSSDATPTLVRELSRVPALERPALRSALLARAPSADSDWRSWHLGRAMARRRLAQLE